MASRDIGRLRITVATVAGSSGAYASGTVAPILVPRIAFLAGHRALAFHINHVVGTSQILGPEVGIGGVGKFGLNYKIRNGREG